MPSESFAVHVYVKVRGVKVEDGGVLGGKERAIGLGQCMRGGGRQDAHELVERLEGLTQLEVNV